MSAPVDVLAALHSTDCSDDVIDAVADLIAAAVRVVDSLDSEGCCPNVVSGVAVDLLVAALARCGGTP